MQAFIQHLWLATVGLHPGQGLPKRPSPVAYMIATAACFAAFVRAWPAGPSTAGIEAASTVVGALILFPVFGATSLNWLLAFLLGAAGVDLVATLSANLVSTEWRTIGAFLWKAVLLGIFFRASRHDQPGRD